MPSKQETGNGENSNIPDGEGSVASTVPGGPMSVTRRGSDVSSVASTSIDQFNSQAITIKCHTGTFAKDIKIPGVEIKLESDEIALKWIEIIRSMMDFNV